MAHSDSEGETIDDLEFDGTTDGEGDEDNENDIDEALLGALEAGVDDVTEADDVRATQPSFFAQLRFLSQGVAFRGLGRGRRRGRVRAVYRADDRHGPGAVFTPRAGGHSDTTLVFYTGITQRYCPCLLYATRSSIMSSNSHPPSETKVAITGRSSQTYTSFPVHPQVPATPIFHGRSYMCYSSSGAHSCTGFVVLHVTPIDRLGRWLHP